MTISRAPSRARSDILAATPRRYSGGMVVSRVDLQNAARQRKPLSSPLRNSVFDSILHDHAHSCTKRGGARVIGFRLFSPTHGRVSFQRQRPTVTLTPTVWGPFLWLQEFGCETL